MRDAVANMLRRALIAAVNDMGAQQLMTVTAFVGEKHSGVPHIQPWGVAGNPPGGGEGLLLGLGGRSDRAVFIGGEHPDHRPKNQPVGGTTIYDAFGQAISFVQSNIRIVATQTVTITATDIVLNGTVWAGAQPGATPVKLASGPAATKLNAI